MNSNDDVLYKKVKSISCATTYKPGWFVEVTRRGQDLFIRSCFEKKKDGKWVTETGRLWYIDPVWDDAQIVMTIFFAHLRNEENEARENFRVVGSKVLSPNYDSVKMGAATALATS